MVSIRTAILTAVALTFAAPALAVPWKNESGHKHRRGEWKHEYRDGDCKVERKWKRNGKYEEEIECHGAPWFSGYLVAPVIMYREPVPQVIELPPMPPGPAYGEIYRDEIGRYCREYQTVGMIGGRQQNLYGTACLQPDGSWAFND